MNMRYRGSLHIACRLLLFFVAILSSSHAYAAQPATTGTSVDAREKVARAVLAKDAKAIPYKSVDGVTLNLYVFTPEGLGKDERRPAIVFFHGGAWTTGHPSKHSFHCKYLASRGMVAITVQYRLIRSHKVTPFECVADARSAMRYIRSHSAELHIAPGRIAAGGGSAGGHLAASAALLDGPEDPRDDLAVSAAPDALVLFCPVINISDRGYRNGAKVIGERHLELSPAHHVKQGAPPTIIFAGTKDGSAPFPAMEQFREQMQKVGSRCDLVAYEGGRHGFDGQPDLFIATAARMDAFLVSLGYLQHEQSPDAVKDALEKILAAP